MFLRFDINGKQLAFCLKVEDKLSEYTYYNAPEGFDPSIHVAEYDGNNITFDLISNNPIVLSEDQKKEMEVGKFMQHKFNGNEFYEKKRAELSLLYGSGQKTLSEIVEIELKLNKVSQLLKEGNWPLALEEINTINSGGALDNALLQSYKNDISDYVSNNAN